MREFLVLGAGFTGLRVVNLLRKLGKPVVWTNRRGEIGAHCFDATTKNFLPLIPLINSDTVILHSIPTLKTEIGLLEVTPDLITALAANPPARIVYLSTTGVYGQNQIVNESTAVQPQTERELLRAAAEAAVQSGPWSSLVLRPAAIYGPHRGIHASMRLGTFRLPENPSNFVSRIHVDDLAALACAALLQDVKGAYPIADDEPCTSLEAAQFCATLLGVPLPSSASPQDLGETRRADRRVDGSAIRKLLGVQLLYPSYKTGFPACLAAEERARSIS